MDPQLFKSLVATVSANGYLFILLAMIIEGPLVTTAAAFAAGLGIFNVFNIYLLSILGDVIADIVYFMLGYWGGRRLIDRFGHHVGLHKNRVERMEKLLHTHAWKTLIVTKLTPGLATTGLITTGISRMPLRQYLKIVLSIIIPKSLFLVLLGFYSGQAHNYAIKYLHLGQYALLIAFIIILMVSFAYQSLVSFITGKIEKS